MARRSLILDTGAVIALARGDRILRAVLRAARTDGANILVPPVVVTQALRGGAADAAVYRVLDIAWVPFVGKRLAIAAGKLLGESALHDAADALVAAEAIRSAPSVLLTSDPDDMNRLIWNRSAVQVVRV